MSQEKINLRTIKYEAIRNGSQYLGTTTVDLPDIAMLADDVTGAGINGTVNVATLGQTDSMQVTYNFATWEEGYFDLFAQETHTVDLRAGIQSQNRVTGTIDVIPIKITIKGAPKTLSMGSLETAAGSDNSVEHEVTYIKITINGVVKIEIDKFNDVFVVNEVDFGAKIRAALGK
ncbi:phage major tail tube protein [Paenibacillus jamilae]|uniref:phage major tail tube protein n=1 Tax=Paenibacillus jamilae TaxID=114136 RepID=UPI002D8D816A|nr:phage major tail tube protein [Paenibacillus jamilae]